MGKNLEQILNEYKEVILLLEESEGELTPEIEELLAINKNDVEDKVTSYYYVLEKLKSDVAFNKEQKERFAHREKVKQNAFNRLKAAVDKAVSIYGSVNLKSKGRFPSQVIETPEVRATAIPYPIIKPETIPTGGVLEQEVEQGIIPLDLVEYSVNIPKLSAAVVKEIEPFLSKNLLPPPVVSIKTDAVKTALLEGKEISTMEIDKNYKVKFS